MKINRRLIFVLLPFAFKLTPLLAQQSTLDIPGIHQLVDQSIAENKLQVKARDQQALASANESANLTLLEKLKGTYRSLQQRYNTLGTAINIADIGIYATPTVKRILSNQQQIIALAQKDPALVGAGFLAAVQFAQEAKSLAGYVAGLTISLGDVNQMRAPDRKMLFDFILSELNKVQELSANLLMLMQYSSLSALVKAANPFQDYASADKSLASQIIQNAKYLK